MTRSMGLSETLRPRSDRLITPTCKVRIVHVPVKPVNGIDMGTFVSVPRTCPAGLVRVPEIVPTALMTPFSVVKLDTVKVPANVPTPVIT